MREKVDILLAVYNAGPYLQAQLDSIFGQSHGNWHLIIRDDCSSDGSADLISDLAKARPGRVTIIDSNGENLGASRNFMRLMRHSTSPYLMFCDQDDVWFPDKVEATLAKMKEMEGEYGEDTPILVHTDLKVVDESLRVVSDSLWKYQLSDPVGGSSLNRLLLQNVATGCTVMINRPLLDLALPIPEKALMHDWWLALVASAFGKIGHIDKTTILYRQHSANDTGAKKASLFELCCNSTKGREFFASHRSVKARIQGQAAAFLKRYEAMLNQRQKIVLETYVRLPSSNFFLKRYYTAKYGFWYTDLTRNIIRLLAL